MYRWLAGIVLTGLVGLPSPSPLPQRWSDPATWPHGQVPGPGSRVHIPPGQTIVLDTATAPLDQLRIEGTLCTDPAIDADVAITANTIDVLGGGVLEIGTEVQPFPGRAVITLTGPRGVHTPRPEDGGLDNDGRSRAIQVVGGGTLRLCGVVPPRTRTWLGDHAAAGVRTLHLADPVVWRAGDRIAVSTTDFHGVGETAILTLAADASGTTLATTQPLPTARWGRLQYPRSATIAGQSIGLVPAPFWTPRASTARVLDERAEVVLLTRSIVVQGADDADWNTHGFGAHVMVMGHASTAQVTGVEFRRCGQRRAMGRYPFHWHMLSWTPANAQGQGGGTFVGDVDSRRHYLRESTIVGSQNRGVTIHGTCGVVVDRVTAVDVKGHAFFLEDGSEQRNTLRDCVAMKVRDPGIGARIKVHDADASGFWITNPDNVVVGNRGSDCDGRGLWNSFATACRGASRNVPMQPSSLTIRRQEDNVGHGNRRQGMMTDFAVSDEAGNVASIRYQPAAPFTLSRGVVWKNNEGGYQNRVGRGTYLDWVAADNNTRDFTGSAMVSVMRGTLLVCRSLNCATPFADPRRIGLSSYHYQLDVEDLVALDYPYQPPTITANSQFVFGGGVFDSSDLYPKSIGLGGFRNSGWLLTNSHAGHLTPPPYFDGLPLTTAFTGKYRYWTLPGAIHDPHGYWGPAGNYLIPDRPFYVHGLANLVAVAPNGSGSWSTPHRFYGLQDIVLDNQLTQAWMGPSLVALRLQRLDGNLGVVDEHTVGNPAQALFFPGMRSFSAARGGTYRLSFPGGQMPQTALRATLHNAWRADDSLLLGLPWPGSVRAGGRYDAGFDSLSQAQKLTQNKTRLFANNGTSLDDVRNDPSGVVMWQDQANDLLWIKPVGGMALNVYGFDGRSEESLARAHVIRIWAQ